MALGKKLKSIRLARGLSQDKLSAMTGGVVSQGAITNLEKRDSASSSFTKELADALQVDLESLLSDSPDWLEKVPEKRIESNSDCVIEQYHDVSGAMGNGLTLNDQPGQITSWRVTAEWIEKNVPANTGRNNLCIVTGFGDSMKGMFNSGGSVDCRYGR